MKNLFIISTLALGLFFIGTNNAQAQNTGTTTVNLILSDVISLETSSANVNFVYDSAEAYNTDQEHTVEDNIKVTSNKNFDISVKANGANFTAGTNSIPVDVLDITAVAGGTMGGTPTTVNLSTTDQNINTNAELGSELTLDVNYKIPATKSSSPAILGKPAASYTQEVIYTATAL